MDTRERVARLLTRSGAAAATLRARAAARVPLLTVLTYHHVADPGPGYTLDPGVADVTPAQFERHLALLARHCTVIGLDALDAALDGAPLPPNPAMITFDDGYRSCHDVALPALRARGLTAVFFVATAYVEQRRLFWWDRIAYALSRARAAGVPPFVLRGAAARRVDPSAPGAADALCRVVKDTRGLDLRALLDELTEACGVAWSVGLERALADPLLMTWAQVQALADAGMDVASHTRSHRVLQTLEPSALADELAGSRAELAQRLGRAPSALAYPVGRPLGDDAALRAAVRAAGYRVGFVNGTGATWVRRGVDPLAIGRVAMGRGLSDALFEAQLAFPALARRAPRRPRA